MSIRSIPEKTAEILFNRFMLQSFRHREVAIYAPSTAEEARNGYDPKLFGMKQFREIYLQFKAPTYSEKKRHLLVRFIPEQHALLKVYRPKTAFYVCPMFSAYADLVTAQKRVRNTLDFLRHFLVIDASILPKDVYSLYYSIPSSHRQSPDAVYKCTSSAGSESLRREDCLLGNQLIQKFKKDEIGSVVLLGKEPDVHMGWLLWTVEDCRASSFGSYIRKPLKK